MKLDARDATGTLPGSEREENERDRPDEIEVRPLDVRADRRLVEVDGVTDGVQQQPGGDQRPRAAGLPAGDREDEDHEREQEHVADRIGEVRDHDERASVRGLDDGIDQDHGPERAGRRRSHEPVEPEARAEGREAPADQQDDPDVEQRVKGQVGDVGDRREGRIAAVPEVVEDVAAGRREQSGADEEPGGALGADEAGARQAAESGNQLEPFVEPRLVQARPTAGVMGDVVKPEHDQARDEGRPPEPEHGGRTEKGRSFHSAQEVSTGFASRFMARMRYAATAVAPSSPRRRINSASSASGVETCSSSASRQAARTSSQASSAACIRSRVASCCSSSSRST